MWFDLIIEKNDVLKTDQDISLALRKIADAIDNGRPTDVIYIKDQPAGVYAIHREDTDDLSDRLA